MDRPRDTTGDGSAQIGVSRWGLPWCEEAVVTFPGHSCYEGLSCLGKPMHMTIEEASSQELPWPATGAGSPIPSSRALKESQDATKPESLNFSS